MTAIIVAAITIAPFLLAWSLAPDKKVWTGTRWEKR